MKVLIISDIHGNIEALRAVEKAAGNVDDILFLGDVLDYGPNPKECISWLRERGGTHLMGNHDHAVVNRSDCKCGEAFKKYSVITREYMWKILDGNDYHFFDGLNPCKALLLDGKVIYTSHAAPSNPFYKYIRPKTTDAELEEEVRDLLVDYVFLGHTHFPMDRTIATTRIINPGSVGQPRDGDSRAAFAIWDNGNIVFHRVEYNVDAACDALQKCQFEQHAIDRLCEVLRTGK